MSFPCHISIPELSVETPTAKVIKAVDKSTQPVLTKFTVRIQDLFPIRTMGKINNTLNVHLPDNLEVWRQIPHIQLKATSEYQAII